MKPEIEKHLESICTKLDALMARPPEETGRRLDAMTTAVQSMPRDSSFENMTEAVRQAAALV